MVDIDPTGAKPGKHTVLAEHDAFDVRVVAHASEYDLGALGGFPRGCSHAAAELAPPLLGLRARAIMHRHLMAVLDEMTGHRIAHDAQSDKRYLRHSSPFTCSLIAGESSGR